MAERFDPHYTWLGIKPKDQPPNHYRLLGIDLFEEDPAVIDHAADQRMAHLRNFGTGKHAAESQRILNEVATARLCLLEAESKTQYDAQLRATLTPAAAAPIPKAKPAVLPTAVAAPPIPRAKPAGPQSAAAAAPIPKVKPVESPTAATRLHRGRSTTIPPVALAVGGVVAVLLLLAIAGAAYVGLKDRPEVADRSTGLKDTGQLETIDGRDPVVRAEEVEENESIAAEEREEPDSDFPPPDELTTTGDVPNTDETLLTVNEADGPPTTSQDDESGGAGAGPGVDELQEADPNPDAGQGEGFVQAEEIPTVGDPPDIPPTVGPQRPAVPDEAARGRVKAEIRSLYKDEYRLARQPVAKVDLAKKLMAAASETTDDQVGAYALLEEARSLAMEAGDGELATSIVEELAERFDVDEWAMKADVVKQGLAIAKTLPERGAVYQAAVKQAAAAVDAQAYDTAIELLGIADRLAQRAREYGLAKECRTRIQELTGEQQQWELAQQARTRLADVPHDPAANRALGLFLCFVQDDWQQGLPLLVRANDPDLRVVLEQESHPPGDAPRKAHLGDLWWDATGRADGVEKEQFTDRACYWYRQAVVGLSGLEKARVERLLEKHDPLWGQVAIGLVGHWKLDEGQGDSALDATGNQHGTYKGSVTWSREGGRVVAVFDANTAEVALGQRNFGNVFSIAVWIKPYGPNITGSAYCVFANEYVRKDLKGIRLRVKCDDTTQGHLYLETNNGSNKSATTPLGVLRLGQWHHVAVLVDRAAGTAAIYVNGRDVTETSEIWPNFKNESRNWWIGGARGGYDVFMFRGSMSDFRLYNRLLSPREITALARMGDANLSTGTPSP